MPIVSRRETRRRLREMARATVDMERGTYAWPDGRAPVSSNGEPQLEKKEILRVSGYSTQSHSHGKKLFEDNYYLRHCQLERDKRDGVLPELAKREDIDAARVVRIAKKMLDLIEWRITNDPDKISTHMLLQYATVYMKMGREFLTAESPEPRNGDKTAHFNAFLGDIIVGMDESELDALSDTQQSHAAQRMAELKNMIDSRLAEREDADDPDVIDAEVSTEPS